MYILFSNLTQKEIDELKSMLMYEADKSKNLMFYINAEGNLRTRDKLFISNDPSIKLKEYTNYSDFLNAWEEIK